MEKKYDGEKAKLAFSMVCYIFFSFLKQINEATNKHASASLAMCSGVFQQELYCMILLCHITIKV